MTFEEPLSPDQLLTKAISTGVIAEVESALKDGADVMNDGDVPHPLAQALLCKHTNAHEIAKPILKRILKLSPGRIFPDALLDLDVTDPKHGYTLLHLAAARRGAEMLKVIWPLYKGRRSIDMPERGKGNRPVHLAAADFEGLTYLLGEGADIHARNGCDLPDGYNQTPLHILYEELFSLSPGLSAAEQEFLKKSLLSCKHLYAGAKGSNDPNHNPLIGLYKKARLQSHSSPEDDEINVSRLFALYEKYGADFHAVDSMNRSIAFYALTDMHTELNATQILGVELALRKGVNFLAVDILGKTPLDYMLNDDTTWNQPSGIDLAFTLLASHGYDIAAVMKKYAAKPVIQSIAPWFEGERSKLHKILTETDIVDELWKDDKPSALLLEACGYGVLAAAFQNPYYADSGAAARKLYQKMEDTLPPQCKEALHTQVDCPAFERDDGKKSSDAVAHLLRRSKKPDTERGTGR